MFLGNKFMNIAPAYFVLSLEPLTYTFVVINKFISR